MQVERKEFVIKGVDVLIDDTEELSSLDILAEELALFVCSFLNFHELLQMRTTSSKWNRLCLVVLEENPFSSISMLVQRSLQEKESLMGSQIPFIRKSRKLELNLKHVRFPRQIAPWLFTDEDQRRCKIPKISSLTLDQNTSMDSLSCEKLLDICNGLQNLHLDDKGFILEKETPLLQSVLKCSSLEKICTSGTISIESLWELFSKESKLHFLDLEACTLKGKFNQSKIPEDVNLLQLKTFIAPRRIEEGLLDRVFDEAQNLSELGFSSFEGVNPDMQLERLQALFEKHYPEKGMQSILQKLSIDYSSDAENVALLKKCTGLKEITIHVKGNHSFRSDSPFCNIVLELPCVEKVSFSFEEIQEKEFCLLVDIFGEKLYSCEIRKMLFDHSLKRYSNTTSNLKRLVLFENCDPSMFLKVLQVFPHLQEVDGSRTGGFIFNHKLFVGLEKYPALKTLRLGSPYTMSSAGVYDFLIWKLSSIFPKLQCVDLRHCDGVPFSIFDDPRENMPQELEVYYPGYFKTQSTIQEVMIANPQLSKELVEKIERRYNRLRICS